MYFSFSSSFSSTLSVCGWLLLQFLAHLIHHQMSYCCGKLEIWEFCEAVWGAVGDHGLKTNQMIENRPRECVGVRWRPYSHSLEHHLSIFDMLSVSGNQGVQTPTASHTASQIVLSHLTEVINRQIYQMYHKSLNYCL